MEMQYIVIEIQTDANNTVATIVTQHHTLYKAESKFHQILSVSAVSQVPLHGAVMFGNNGEYFASKTYSHDK